MADEDLNALTPDQLLAEMRRCTRPDTKRAVQCLDLWLAKTGHTIESVSAMIADRLSRAAGRNAR